MNVLELTAVVGAASVAAGFLGSLTGLGGGVIIVPLLTLALGVDIRYAIGASLVSVIATSSGAASAYVREGYSNIRVGMFLEIATTSGALIGAFLTSLLSTSVIAVIFGIALLYSAYLSLRKRDEGPPPDRPPDRIASWLQLDGSYPTHAGSQSYHVRHVPAGFGLMWLAGILSGLLGIGSGAVKVLALDRAMGLPFKVSTTTSNFMIGVTAAASAGIYFSRGAIPPLVVAPVALGILLGALIGARLLLHLSNKTLRLVFLPVIAAAALEMIIHGFRPGAF